MPAMTKRDKFWGLLGILFFLLLNYPLLQIVNLDTLVGGISILALYLFAVWLLAIGLLFFFSRQLSFRSQADEKESKE